MREPIENALYSTMTYNTQIKTTHLTSQTTKNKRHEPRKTKNRRNQGED